MLKPPGTALLCYVTPKEHLGLPNLDDVKQVGDSHIFEFVKFGLFYTKILLNGAHEGDLIAAEACDLGTRAA